MKTSGAENLMDSKILLFDLETSFKILAGWGMYNQNFNHGQIIQDMNILCWAAKWLDDDYVYYDSLHLHKKEYKRNPTNDLPILESLWEMMDEADIIVAHNGDRFDIPTINARFKLNGLPPPSPYRTVDTLKIARREFKFTSNRLDYLGEILGVGRKLDTDFSLWTDIVLKQDKKAFNKMLDYNIQDVQLLEDVYLELRGWDKKHPSTVILGNLEEPRCNVCGSSHIIKNGSYATNTGVYKKFKCQSCGHNLRSRFKEKIEKEQNHNILRSL